jgi:hypothetical protein
MLVPGPNLVPEPESDLHTVPVPPRQKDAVPAVPDGMYTDSKELFTNNSPACRATS